MLQAHSFLWNYLWVAPNLFLLLLAILLWVRGFRRVFPAFLAFTVLSAVAELAEIARELGERSGGINAAEFRDRVGTGRKLAIHILEFFDRVGFTRRVKDSHVLRQPGLFR